MLAIWEADWSLQPVAKTAWTMACGTTPEQDSTDSTIVTGTLSDRIFSSSFSPWWFMAYSWLSSRTVPESEWKHKQTQNPNRRTSIKINVSQSKRQHRTLKLCLFSGAISLGLHQSLLSTRSAWHFSGHHDHHDLYPQISAFPAGFPPIATWRVCNSLVQIVFLLLTSKSLLCSLLFACQSETPNHIRDRNTS